MADINDVRHGCVHGKTTTNCPECIGASDAALLEDYEISPADQEAMSEVEDRMDTMIQAASTPTLATLFKRGKEAGLLKPVTGYSDTA